MINRRRALKRPRRFGTRTVDALLDEARAQPATKTAKPRRTPRKVARREPVNHGLELNDLDALGALHWFLVRVPSNKELAAERILDDAGLVCFVPIERKFSRANNKVKRRTELRFPQIPGYVLVGLESPQVAASLYDGYGWDRLFRFKLVRGVVGHDGRPVRVPFGQLRPMLQRQYNFRPVSEFEPGARAEILEGPFEGHVSEICDIKGGEAIMVLNLFGGEQEVRVALKLLGRAA